MDDELIEYIKRNLKSGHEIDTIKKVLINAGYDIKKIDAHANYILRTKRILLEIIVLVIIIAAIIAGSYYFFVIHYKSSVSKNKPELLQNDSAVCERLQDIKLKIECKNKFSAFKNNKTCDEDCLDKEILNKALISRDLSLCNDLRKESYKVYCERSLEG